MRREEDDEPRDSSIQAVYNRVRSRYFFKIAVAILVLTVALIGAGYVTLAQVEASVQDDAEETLVNAADREVQGLDQFVQDRHNDATRLSSDAEIRRDDRTQIRTVLEENLEGLPGDVTAVHYYNMETSTVEVSTRDALDGESVDRSSYPWAADADEFGNALSATSFEPYAIEDGPRMAFGSPVTGQASHAIVITVDLAERSELLTSPVDGGVIEIVSPNGQVVLAEEPEDILTEFQLFDELDDLQEGGNVSEAQVSQADGSHDRVEDDRTVVATLPLEEAEWTVAVIAPQDAVFDTVGDVTQSILVLIGLSVIGFVVVGAVISRDINNSLEQMTGYAEGIEGGDLEVEIDDSRADEFGQLASLFRRIRDTMREQLSEVERQAEEATRERERAQEAKDEAERAQAEAQEAKAEAEALSRHLEEKAEEYRANIEAAANGDLTRRVDTDSRSEAMTEIGEAVNEMLEGVEQLVVRIQRVAAEVDEQSDEVTVSTEEIEASSAEVAESVEEISVGADQQREQLATAASEMSDLSATVEEIASSSDTVADQIAQAADLGQDGQAAASEVIETIDDIEAKADDTVTEMEALREEVERIGEVVELIDDIAAETNLLALNASIEAAGAGDEGDGFAVVANEVKSLAEETSEATQEVEELVATVEESTESVADDVFEMRSGVEEGRTTIDRTVETLEGIVDAVEDANAGVQSINEATDDQAESTQEVASMVDDVTSVSERTADEAQNVSAAAEEQTSAIQQIGNNAESLSGRADELQTLVDQFETDDSGDANDGQPADSETDDNDDVARDGIDDEETDLVAVDE
ncbi:methyl-accepting chemotaxis protein [Halobiforma nitratireducens]|uniref:methyl-accepting chemotaxis protein n=1 Tax=Halobiforma nitratireducens TaxID=130048 RepID=UPI0006781352|nr:methyl-accepting chemotaxis protein [Halobiforma nitratireducens]